MEIAEIHSYLQKLQHVNLATIEDGEPRVRPMNFVAHEKDYWLVSYGKDAKIHQLMDNPAFEICATISHEDSLGSIRARGRAKIIENLEEKQKIQPHVWFFDRFFSGIDDTNFVPIALTFNQIVSQNPKDKRFYKFHL